MSDALIEAAVRQTYADYLAAFQREDAAEAVQAYFQLPCLLVSAQGGMVLGSVKALEQVFTAMKAGLAAKDYARSEIQDMSVKVLGETLAAISLVVLRYDRRGVEFERLGAFYLLRKTGEHWRFVQLALYDAGRLLRLA